MRTHEDVLSGGVWPCAERHARPRRPHTITAWGPAFVCRVFKPNVSSFCDAFPNLSCVYSNAHTDRRRGVGLCLLYSYRAPP